MVIPMDSPEEAGCSARDNTSNVGRSMAHSVLHVCDKFGVSGSSIHGVSRLFAWWFPRYDKTRYVPYLAGLKHDDDATRGLRVLGLPLTMFGRTALDPRLIGDIGREIARTNARILHVHGYAASNFGRIAARRAGIPLVLHEHFADPRMPAYQKIPDFLLRGLTARAIAVSRSTADFMVSERFVPKGKVEVVFNGAPLDEFASPRSEGDAVRAALGIPKHAPLITTIGRLNAQKGHAILLSAAAQVIVRFPETRFLIAGDGDLLAPLQSQAKALGITPSIIFAGHRSDIPALLAATDIFCISSNYEGTPLVLFEAMAAGKAIVSTAVDGCLEVIEDGQTGLLVPPADPGRMAEALMRVLGDRPLADSLARDSQEASKRYDINACVSMMERIYDDLLGIKVPKR